MKSKLLIAIFVLVAGAMPPNFLWAQSEGNPFELLHRLGMKPGARVVDPVILDNPFELIVRPNASVATQPKKTLRKGRKPFKILLPKIGEGLSPKTLTQRLHFGIVTLVLLFLAFLMTLSGVQIQKTFQAFLNDNLFGQLHREREARGIWPFLPAYFFFLLNVGFFGFFLCRQFNVAFGGNLLNQLLICLAGSITLFLLKHLILGVLALIFPIEKEIGRYLFLLVVFGSVLGMVLAPVNIFLAYGNAKLHENIIWGTLGLVAVVYLYRSFRGVWIANRFMDLNKFHFLMYICSVEIAPLLVFGKLISQQL